MNEVEKKVAADIRHENVVKGRVDVQKAGPGSRLPKGMQWIGHCGRKAQRRYLKQAHAKLLKDLGKALKSEDSDIRAEAHEAEAALKRLTEVMEVDTDPDYAVLLFSSLATKATDKGYTWSEAVNKLCDEFIAKREQVLKEREERAREANSQEGQDAVEPPAAQGGGQDRTSGGEGVSPVGGAPAELGEHQQPGAGDREQEGGLGDGDAPADVHRGGDVTGGDDPQ